MTAAAAALFVLSIADEASAQANCTGRYNYCYSYHQCMINYCAGYRVNCGTYWAYCGSYCYRAYSGYLTRQFGPLPKYCARR